MTKLRSELSSSYKKKHERVENNTVLEIKYKIIDMINLLENKGVPHGGPMGYYMGYLYFYKKWFLDSFQITLAQQNPDFACV